MAEAIVRGAFVGIDEDIVRLAQLLEFLLGRVIARVFCPGGT